MFSRITSAACLALIVCVANVAQAVVIISDPVEPGGGWTAANGFSDGAGLTAPIEGGNLIFLASADADPASINYANLLGAGTYTATFWVHNFSNNSLPPPGLTAHLQAAGSNLDDLLTSSVTPVPTAGQWQEWTLVYDVPLGDVRIGDPIGFLITDVAGQGNGAFDSLQVDFEAAAVPEPTSFVLWAVIAAGGFMCFMMRSRRIRV